MKKFLFMSVLLGALAALTLTGCGSSGGSTYEANGVATPDVPNTGSDSIIVTNTGDGAAVLSYTKVSDGSVLVDCGPGGCGDVFAGNLVTGDGDGDTLGGLSSTASGAESCGEGEVWCSIEETCVASTGGSVCPLTDDGDHES